jgi:hypothetical protein
MGRIIPWGLWPFLLSLLPFGLRGNEGFKLDLCDLLCHISRGRGHAKFPHVVAPPLGRCKGWDGERPHLLFMVPVIQSGIKIRCYLEWLAERREEQGFMVPVIQSGIKIRCYLEWLAERREE